jgi:hypothetical protein
MKKLLAAVALASVAFASGCAGNVASQDPTAPASEASAITITITTETDTDLVGSFVNGSSVISFEEHLATPMVNTKLVINGAEYDYVYDIVHSTLNIDGHSNSILGADASALAVFEKAFDHLGGPTRMREQLYKTIALMAAAPRGTTFKIKSIVPQTNKVDEVSRSYCDNDDGITYICAQNNLGGCQGTYAGANGSNPIYNAAGTSGTSGGTNNYGGYVNGCTSTPSIIHEHEVCEGTASSDHESGQSSYHGRVTWGARVGWSAKACEGRCGAGCPQSYNFYVTKDCTDHDVCLDNHPSASSTSTFGDCGNEFDRASGDFTYGTSSGFTSACGFAMWGDNTR